MDTKMTAERNQDDALFNDDPLFLEQVFRQYERLMYSIVKQYISNLDDQADIVGDVLVKMVEQEKTLRKINQQALTTYIAAITRNTAINFLKHKCVIQRTEPVSWEEAWVTMPLIPSYLSPEDTALRTERQEMVRKAWQRLSSEDRLLLEGKYILGLTDRELAATLGCKESSIRMKLTRAKRRAAKEIQNGGDDYAQ